MENNLKNVRDRKIKRGEIWYVNLKNGVGSEQSGYRPCLIVQNDTGNKYSPTVIVAVLSTRLGKHKLPTHVLLSENSGIPKKSIILLEQIMVVDKKRLSKYITTLTQEDISKVNKALLISLGLK